MPLGLNLLLWVAALVAILVALSRWGGVRLTRERRWMIPTLLLFATLVVWRDSTWLVALNLFAIVVALSLGALRTALPFHRVGLTDYAVGLVGFASVKIGAAINAGPITYRVGNKQYVSAVAGLSLFVFAVED